MPTTAAVACFQGCELQLAAPALRALHVQVQQFRRNLQAVDGCAGMPAELLSREQAAAICQQASTLGLPGVQPHRAAHDCAITCAAPVLLTAEGSAVTAASFLDFPSVEHLRVPCMLGSKPMHSGPGCEVLLLCRSDARGGLWRPTGVKCHGCAASELPRVRFCPACMLHKAARAQEHLPAGLLCILHAGSPCARRPSPPPVFPPSSSA